MTEKKVSKCPQKDAPDGLPAQEYEPTPQEKAVMEALRSCQTARSPAPRMKVVSDNGPYQITIDHDEPTVGF